eukprot:scaffold74665_cov42-Phaeocystis_antarctica.AAC.1
MLHEQQDLEGAITLCRKAVEVDPLCETAHVHMAHLCLQKNDLEAAVASYDLAVGLLRMKQARYLVITPPLAVGLLRMKQARYLVIIPTSRPSLCRVAAAHEALATVAPLTMAPLTYP